VLERRPRVLLVDDRRQMAEMLADGLAERGYQALVEDSGTAALKRLEEEQIDALVTDLRMPDLDGLHLLAASRRLQPERPVIVMTAFAAIDSAIESIRQGAYHYLTKPFKLEELALFLERALDDARVRRTLRTTLRERFQPSGVVGKSKPLRAALELVHRVAQSDVPVLLLGETGTGKGVFAKLLHADGPRAGRAFVAVNCAALPEALLESELFGHQKGAFTGAGADRRGLFEEADGGTLLLDEIGELPLLLQAKLLHVLESGRLRPVGANRERQVDVRVVAATNRNLRDCVAAGTFREDLLFRLDVVSVEIPPLRRRPEDIPELVAHFLEAARARYPQSPVESLSPPAMARLLEHPWPGNVRELQHLVERLVLLGQERAVKLEDLPAQIRVAQAGLEGLISGKVLPIVEVDRRYAAWALEQFGGHRGHTAEALDITPKTLSAWLAGKS
jgi:two-component system, NtrC family, response regulator HydG